MPRISNSVIEEIKKVLKEQFNIEMEMSNGEYTFSDKDNSKYKLSKRIYFLPHASFKAEDMYFKDSNGKEIRCIESAYDNGLGNIIIIFEENCHIWSIRGNNYPRAHRLFTAKTAVDYPHIELDYHGKKSRYYGIEGDYDTLISKKTSLEIISNDLLHTTKKGNEILASFILMNYLVLDITFNGIYLKKLSNEYFHDSETLISHSYSPDEIREALSTQIDLDFFQNRFSNMDVVNKMISFLISRVDELVSYLSMHQEDFLKRFDDMTNEASIKEKERINERKKIFMKDYSK